MVCFNVMLHIYMYVSGFVGAFFLLNCESTFEDDGMLLQLLYTLH